MGVIVRRASPNCSQAKARAMTLVVLHTLKGLVAATSEKPSDARLLRAEFQDLLCLYLGSRAADRS
jgi:hypothetical protein